MEGERYYGNVTKENGIEERKNQEGRESRNERGGGVSGRKGIAKRKEMASVFEGGEGL